MRVARGGDSRIRIVDAADNVHVGAQRFERGEARRQLVAGAELRRNPVALGDPVAVEPEDETRLDGRARLWRRRVRGAVHVEHGSQRRQSDPNRRAGHTQAPEESSSAERHALSPNIRSSEASYYRLERTSRLDADAVKDAME